jgi:hypothetical protein
MNTGRRFTLPTLALVAMLALAGCGPTSLDQGQLRDLIVAAVSDGIGITPTDVDCPDVENPEDGTTFQCTTILDGQTLRMNGVVTDADEGTVEVENADAILFVALLEKTIAEDFGPQLDATLVVDCGDTEVRVEEVGSSFGCTATDEFGEQARIVVEVLDVDGNVTYEIG